LKPSGKHWFFGNGSVRLGVLLEHFAIEKSIATCVAIVICVALASCSQSRIRRLHVSPLRVERRVQVPKGLKVGEVLHTAKSYLGVRYRFGGNTVNGFDCSGLVQRVLQRHGIRFPHSSAMQAQYGDFVGDPGDLRPGDLVFFQTYKKGPSHVGFYLGRHKFIHASSGRKRVMITSINSSYYAPRFLGGKRIF